MKIGPYALVDITTDANAAARIVAEAANYRLEYAAKNGWLPDGSPVYLIWWKRDKDGPGSETCRADAEAERAREAKAGRSAAPAQNLTEEPK